jgi:hypothetical protein
MTAFDPKDFRKTLGQIANGVCDGEKKLFDIDLSPLIRPTTTVRFPINLKQRGNHD